MSDLRLFYWKRLILMTLYPNRIPRTILLLSSFVLLAALFAACSSTQNSTDPATVVEDYLSVMVANEKDKIPNLVCPAYEAGARTEFDSFGAVGSAMLDSVECTATTNGDTATVTCTGAINFTYNGETQSLDLSGNVYSAQRVDGEWRMCGYD